MTHEKKSAAELRAELRALRKEHVRPVSRMRMGDISHEIEMLRKVRETTPAVDAVPSAPMRKSESAVKSIKEAKKMEFPMKPGAEVKTGGATKTAKKAPVMSEKKKSKLERLKEMMAEMSDTDDE